MPSGRLEVYRFQHPSDNRQNHEVSVFEKFVDYYLKNAVKIAEEVKYIALPKIAMDMTQEHFQSKKWGTVFKGHAEVGMKVEDLMKKEKK